jgi:hypothetical protein
MSLFSICYKSLRTYSNNFRPEWSFHILPTFCQYGQKIWQTSMSFHNHFRQWRRPKLTNHMQYVGLQNDSPTLIISLANKHRRHMKKCEYYLVTSRIHFTNIKLSVRCFNSHIPETKSNFFEVNSRFSCQRRK